VNLPSLKRLFARWSQATILYEVTAQCNLGCSHCYNVWKDNSTSTPGELSTTQSKRLIEKAIRDSQCEQFVFTGGEPLLRTDLEGLVGVARSHCPNVILITNGTLLSRERIENLLIAGVTLFELPLNSNDRQVHDRMAGEPECFDRVTRAAVDIRDCGGELAFVFVGTTLNIADWSGVLELGVALGARQFLFNRYNAGGECRGSPESLLPDLESLRNGLAIAQEFAARTGVSVGASIPIPPCLINTNDYPDVQFGFCTAGTAKAYFTLDPLGNVRPCNHSKTVLGNLFDHSLKSLAHTNTMHAFMQARPDFCRGCAVEKECQGGCKAAAEVCYGDLAACEPFLEINKSIAVRLSQGPESKET
jgi:radical SAM protein with 4Fe4S-binding SPASM domain